MFSWCLSKYFPPPNKKLANICATLVRKFVSESFKLTLENLINAKNLGGRQQRDGEDLLHSTLCYREIHSRIVEDCCWRLLLKECITWRRRFSPANLGFGRHGQLYNFSQQYFLSGSPRSNLHSWHNKWKFNIWLRWMEKLTRQVRAAQKWRTATHASRGK